MLKLVSAVSGVYDLVVGAVLLLGTGWMAATFGVAPPELISRASPILQEDQGELIGRKIAEWLKA